MVEAVRHHTAKREEEIERARAKAQERLDQQY